MGLLLASTLHAQSAKEAVQQAVRTELAASRSDQSHWSFRQAEKFPENTVAVVVQTSHGSLHEKIEQDGHPLSAEGAAEEAKHVNSFLHDPSQQAKQKRDADHDDASAAKLLAMLPTAFLWKPAGETPDTLTFAFQPDPAFHPPDMEARVMSAMAGELVVDRAQHRIRSIRGKLAGDVMIGFGVLGRLRQGGTFDVERREIAPGLWQIVETHVHIDGRALLFKTIGEQQDETNSAFVRVPDAATLEQAAALLAERKHTGCPACAAR